MACAICTIGFTGKTAEEFFRLLREAGVKKVIDVRENRIGQLSGYAKHPDIEFFLREIAGIAYEHRPELAPSAEIRKAYRDSRDWPVYEREFLALMRARGIPERLDLGAFRGTVALLCSEPGPEKCHRRLVAELVAERLRANGQRVAIEHLVAPAPVKRPRKVSAPAKKTRGRRRKLE